LNAFFQAICSAAISSWKTPSFAIKQDTMAGKMIQGCGGTTCIKAGGVSTFANTTFWKKEAFPISR
jgi:hypothetical protein